MTTHSDTAAQIKSALTMQAVAERYGFTPNRAGFIPCPFHEGDNTASLKLYPDGRGWCCFGCGKGGDVIKFVQYLFNINFAQAVVRLNYDFGLGLNFGKPTQAEIDIAAKRRENERRTAALNDLRVLIYLDKATAYRALWRRYLNEGITLEEKRRMDFLDDWLTRNQHLEFDPLDYPVGYIEKISG